MQVVQAKNAQTSWSAVALSKKILPATSREDHDQSHREAVNVDTSTARLTKEDTTSTTSVRSASSHKELAQINHSSAAYRKYNMNPAVSNDGYEDRPLPLSSTSR